LEENEDDLESHIDADQSMHRREAVRLRPISSPETAGGGRKKSVTPTATAESREG
jgi:hypothetical protein